MHARLFGQAGQSRAQGAGEQTEGHERRIVRSDQRTPVRLPAGWRFPESSPNHPCALCHGWPTAAKGRAMPFW